MYVATNPSLDGNMTTGWTLAQDLFCNPVSPPVKQSHAMERKLGDSHLGFYIFL